MVKAQYWVKARNCSGIPAKEDFKLVEEDLPELKDGGWSSIPQSRHRLSFWPVFPNCMNITEILGGHQVIFTVRNVVAGTVGGIHVPCDYTRFGVNAYMEAM